MPRKAFMEDLDALQRVVVGGCITDVRRGDDDGSFVFTFVPPKGEGGGIEVTGFVPELSDYPKSYQCFIYANTEDAPSSVTSTLEKIQTSGSDLPLRGLLFSISTALTKAMTENIPRPGPGSDDEDGDDDLSVGGWEDDNDFRSYPTGLDSEGDSQMTDFGGARNGGKSKENKKRLTAKLKEDLRQAQAAGFKVGVLGDFKGGIDLYVSLGICISKLGISSEAIAAWGLDQTKYLILLIHYSNYYQDLATLAGERNGYNIARAVTTCVGTSTSYKPTLTEARRAFSKITQVEPGEQPIHDENSDLGGGDAIGSASDQAEDGFKGIFISRPLNELMNGRLALVLRYRLEFGLSWDGAEALHTDFQGRGMSNTSDIPDKYFEVSEPKTALARIVSADALSGATTAGRDTSFPLLAMQFALRHLVRCTEFCMVCHAKVNSDFEALKPYVCSSPLCLYQYMSLGFGPSIEYEIVSQPTVVDLLVSFCYHSATSNALAEFPSGMNLLAPSSHRLRSRYNQTNNELYFEESRSAHGLKMGDWVAITGAGSLATHFRVLDVSHYPTVKVGPPVRASLKRPVNSDNGVPGAPSSSVDPSVVNAPQSLEVAPGTCAVYNFPFDALSPLEKPRAIVTILDTLPSVVEMKSWLERNTKVGEEASLKEWVNRISPSALGVLRWIIASNRSCIVPVDQVLDSEGSVTPDTRGKKKDGAERRIPGLDDWLQFRFAMGAPDKEQRFVNCVRNAQQRLNLTHPTLFAFHGSPLRNWHSIIREGLHFKSTLHGRAYGNGCYHSLDLRTSMSYSSLGFPMFTPQTITTSWPQSVLDIKSAISLNEIVNAPNEYVSKRPHLVVAQLDWIQTRYLFVQTIAAKSSSRRDISDFKAHPQDPEYFPVGLGGPLVIPAMASSYRARRLAQDMSPPGRSVGSSLASFTQKLTRRSRRGDSAEHPVIVDDGVPEDDASIADGEDIMAVFSDDELDSIPKSECTLGITVVRKEGSFEPGKLDMKGVSFLPPPSYASNLASKRLNSDLQSLFKLQEKYPLEELGFYIDPELVENVYQWILELHSFDEKLPLSQDMKRLGVKSIVLEIRFGPSYPMSPPFVRVVKPRFRGFGQGGGGHVTIGGALCMELLTNSGWSAVSSMESVLLQVRMAMSAESPPARLAAGPIQSYHPGEAREAYIRACKSHGWGIPADFESMV